MFRSNPAHTGSDGTLGQVPKGVLKWKYTTGSWNSDSSPAIANGVVYVGSSDGYLHAIDAVTGSLKWKYKTGSGISSSPAVVNGVVYVVSYDSNLYAIDAVKGTLNWKYSL